MRCFARMLTVVGWVSLLVLLSVGMTSAQVATPAITAEAIRARLLQAQLVLVRDPASAAADLAQVEAAYRVSLSAALATGAPDASARVSAGLADARAAIASGDGPALAEARALLWTAILDGGYRLTSHAVEGGDVATARTWLGLREFRRATRFSRPNADATLALDALASGTITRDEALAALRADLLDTYQSRLGEALAALRNPQTQAFPLRCAELAGLVDGYLRMLGSAYSQQRGDQSLAQLMVSVANLRASVRAGVGIDAALAQLDTHLEGFRAAPLALAEQQRRAGQLLRFLALVPVEYARGVHNGRVTTDLEIREAITFHAGAAAAFADLRDILAQVDSAATVEVSRQIDLLGRELSEASAISAADPTQIQATADQIGAQLGALMPTQWLQRNAGADFDVIAAALDQMEQAVAASSYELAESARLDAYAILESGPEARLIAFAPALTPVIEGLFWYGHDGRPGLAGLIDARAPLDAIRTTRQTLDVSLAEAERALSGNSAPLAVATNAAVIVFREGLEAVLILASLMGSMKLGEQRRMRRPLWVGTVIALAATVVTWLLARGALSAMARYGERLEAVVSLIAIVVLLLITNWFFHDVYWKGWMASFHQQKRRIISGATGQWLGLVVLGFSSIYREGFETVLFLQALVLESGTPTVLAGTGAGLAGTLLIGLAVFGMQARLPHKKMLIVTGMLIGAV
ncbi:MAG: iron permease, partial [Oscillochloris sp.]|nr:iron permease [Oscillochloris sp.]